MILRQLLQGLISHEVPTRSITGVACHSQQVKPGMVFVALRGSQHDGHAFLEDAMQRGAAALVVERPATTTPSCPVIVVPDTRQALSVMAARWYGEPSRRLRMVGVTGTCGKTTTAYLTKAILEAAGHQTGLLGTVAYEIGARHLPSSNTTPGPLLLQQCLAQMVEQELDWCAMEVSSHALDQHRIDGLWFDAAIWTCLGADHLDYHKTLERYAAAKRRLFSYLREGGKAIINLDDAYGRSLLEMLPASAVVTYGIEQPAMVTARILACGWDGLHLIFESPWGTFPVSTPMVGRHNAANIAAACTACLALEIPVPAIQQALVEFPQVPGRLERVPNDAGVHVIVDYAHTADALRLVLLSLRELVRGKLFVVFGCGGDRDTTKRPAMGQVASLLADHVMLTSDNPRSEDPLDIIHQIKTGFVPGFEGFRVLVDREEAITTALAMAHPDDAVVIAGKGHEAYQIFDRITTPFSDREVVERYFARLARAIAV